MMLFRVVNLKPVGGGSWGRIGFAFWLLFVVLFTSGPASSQTTRTWTGQGSEDNANVWTPGNSTRGNWSRNRSFSSGQSAMFTDLNNGTNILIVGNFNVGNITFSNSARAFSFAASGQAQLTLQSGITNRSTNAQAFVATNLTLRLANSQTWNATNGALTFLSRIDNNARNLTLTGPGTLTLGGGVIGSGALITTNAGLRRITAATSFTGNTTVSGGTLELSADAALGGTPQILIETGGTLLFSGSAALTNRINDSVAFRLGGGALETGGLSERLGTLTLSANSTLNFGNGSSVIRFAASSGQTWTSGRTLTLANWTSGSDRLFFGTSASGLTAGQLSQISFLNPGGFATGTYPAMMLGSGEIVPVPEPVTWLAPLSLLGWLGWRRMRHHVRTLRQ